MSATKHGVWIGALFFISMYLLAALANRHLLWASSWQDWLLLATIVVGALLIGTLGALATKGYDYD